MLRVMLTWSATVAAVLTGFASSGDKSLLREPNHIDNEDSICCEVHESHKHIFYMVIVQRSYTCNIIFLVIIIKHN